MIPSLADPRHAERLTGPLARFEFALAAAIGFAWGPPLFHFVRHVADWSRPSLLLLTVALVGILGTIGARLPAGWYRLRPWERTRGGRIYERLGVRAFKRWMSHGDLMNGWIRRRIPDYRVIRPAQASAELYAQRTVIIERAHLAWGLGTLPLIGYAVAAGATGFGVILMLVNVVTNGWPIVLQRYNRVRAERVAARN